jgi:hypothetical protein
MKRRTLWLLLIPVVAVVLLLILRKPCDQKRFGTSGCALRECIGKEQHLVLSELTEAFELFLRDNGYLNDTTSRADGYKAYLRQILTMTSADTTWVYRHKELEELLHRIEKQHIAELLFDNTLTQCVINIPYPEGHIMANIRQIIPQHTVSPARFAQEFINVGDDAQLDDPVLRIMLAIEYFLGPVLGQLRPETPGCGHDHHH